MNSLRHILLVAYRDFMQRAKSRAFLISIVVIIGLLAAVGPLLAFEMRDPAPYDIGTLGSQPEGLSGALAASRHIQSNRPSTNPTRNRCLSLRYLADR